MKKYILMPILLFSINLAFPQNIAAPNGGFENWNSTVFFENPNGYHTSNDDYFYFTNLATVLKSSASDAYQGSFALKLQTKAFELDTIIGIATYAKKDDNGNMIEGFPFNEKPQYFQAFAKYNCADTDPSEIDIIFKKNGSILSYNSFYFKGSQSTFKEFKLTLEPLNDNPDTVVIRFASSSISKKKSSKGVNAGNWIIIDYISFTGASSPIPNGDFEAWTPKYAENPLSWSTLNDLFVLQDSIPYATKTRAFHSGNFAVRIQAQQIFGINDFINASYITTGKFNVEKFTSQGKPDVSGGFPIYNIPDSISFWYKFDNSFNIYDSALFILELKKNPLISRTVIRLGSASAYTFFKFKTPVNLGFVPDSANIILSSVDYYVDINIAPGNVLLVDDINFIYTAKTYNISGTLTYDNSASTPLANNAKVFLKNSLGKKIDSVFTDALGKFQFSKVIKGNYSLDAFTSKKAYFPKPNDALIINRAYIGTYTFKTPLRRKTADVNNDSKVNSLDALTINRRFVGTISSFKIPNYIFETPAVTIEASDVIINFKGICAGDVTGFYTPPAL